MTLRRNNPPKHASMDQIHQTAEAPNCDQHLGDGPARKFLSKKSWGYIQRSSKMALDAWNSLQAWLDSELIPKPSTVRDKTPFKLDAIQLEDRILYSASPLMAIANPGDSTDPATVENADLLIGLDEIVLNLFEATGQGLDAGANPNVVAETIQGLSSLQSASQTTAPFAGDDSASVEPQSQDVNDNGESSADSAAESIQPIDLDNSLLARIDEQLASIESLILSSHSTADNSLEWSDSLLEDLYRSPTADAFVENPEGIIPIEILFTAVDTTQESPIGSAATPEASSVNVSSAAVSAAKLLPVDSEPVDSIAENDLLWDEAKRVIQLEAGELPDSPTNFLPLNQNLVDDGDFHNIESPATYPGYLVFSEGSEISSWHVEHGFVDLNGEHYIPSPTGGRSIDLNGGEDGGSISQAIATQPGQLYQVTFAVTGEWLHSGQNQYGNVNGLKVSASDQSETFALTKPSDWSPLSNAWEYRTFTFVATDTTTQLRFASVDGNTVRPAILANVHLTPLPEEIAELLASDSSLKFNGQTGEFFRVAPTAWNLANALESAATGVEQIELDLNESFRNQVEDYVGEPAMLEAGDTPAPKSSDSLQTNANNYGNGDIEAATDAIANESLGGDSRELLVSRNDTAIELHEVVFVDSTIDNVDQLLADLRLSVGENVNLEIVYLDNTADGILAIGDYLSQSDLLFDAIHIVSHGNANGFELGSTWFNDSTVVDRAGDLQFWRNGLSQDADLLIYGCSVASTNDGQKWLDSLGEYLQVDIAASDDLTGSAVLGGDWDLEYVMGNIESSWMSSLSATSEWQGVLAFTTSDDTASTPNNVPITIDIATNDTGSPTILDISNPSSGTATYSGSTITYTPTAGYTGSTSLNYLATDGTEGLVNYWKLDGNATDSIGTNHGTLVNGPTTTTGQFGSALTFDEVNDYVTVSDIAYGTNFSISFAFRISDNSGSLFQYLYSHGTVQTQNSINVYLGETGSSFANTLRTIALDGNDATTGVEIDVNLGTLGVLDGNWHTYTLTVSSGSGATVYIDGTSRASNSTVGRDGINATGSVYFGARNDLDANRFLGGSLDSVSIFNKAMTAGEVASREVSGSAVGTLNLSIGGEAPINAFPGTQGINEDTSLVLSSGNSNQISIADSDAGGANNEVTISVTNGTLTLAGTSGLTFVTGDGTTDSTMTVRGTATAINTALNGLSYSPTANYNGSATLSITTEDSSLLSLDLSANLQGRYEFTGNTNDTGPGTAQNGTFNGNAAITTNGTRGQVLSLDGSGDYVRITGTYSNPTEVTIGGWVNRTAGTGRSEFISLSDRVHIALDEAGNGVKGSIQTGASTWVDLASGKFITGTGWHHVMYTYSDTSNIHTLYIDGVVVASSAIASSIYWTGAGDTYIGAHPTLTSFTNGLIDEARIYNRALSATEVAVLATDLSRIDVDSVVVNLASINDAPVLNNLGNMSLTTITESQTTNSGNTVSSIILSAGGDRITDVDSGAVEGIAISSLNSGNGTWQYSLNGGSSWSNVGAVSESSALLLRATDLVRFVPNGVNGTEASFTFRAWDQSTGTAGTNANTTSNGGATAFSTAIELAKITVTESNSTPTGTTDTYTLNEDSSLTTTWWNTAWTRRSQITFTGNNFGGAQNLTDFPVLVAFNSSNIDYALTQNSGQDLRFFDANGSALAYEIESWNESGISYVWVRVPTVDIGVSDSIFVYYGNGAATAGESSSAVWSSNYASVFHFDDPGLIADDSTTNNRDGMDINSPTTVVGRIGNALDFDGISNYVDAGSNSSVLNSATAVTVSGWINTDTVSGSSGIYSASINNGGASTGTSRFALERTGNNIQVIIRSDDSTSSNITTTTNPLSTGTWYHVAAVVDVVADTVQIYIDGVLQTTSGTVNAPGTAFLATDSARTAIGAGDDGSSPFFDGRIDELQIATTARSAAWVKAQYLAETTSFVTIAAAQSAPALSGVLANDTDADGARLTAILVAGPSNATSFTLNADGTFTYTPNADFAGQDTFTYRSSDGSAQSAITTVTLTVSNINDAPVLADTSLSITVAEDAGIPTGVVGSLVSSFTGGVSDVDSGAVKGIAITASVETNGTWYYTINNGTTWTAVGAVSSASSLLLADNANTRLYFAPGTNYNGTSPSALTVRGWDQTSGTAGTKVSTSSNGGITAFSSSTDVIDVNVTAVNDAPVLGDTALSITVAEDAGIPTGVVGSLISSFTGGVSDVDSGAVKGIAITASVETNGTWYYTINNGTTWTAVGSVSSASSLLLADNANTRLYFAPGTNYNGTSSSALTVRGWDQTSGTAGTKVSTSSNGGTTAFSSSTDVIDVNVTAVNDAPVLADTSLSITVSEDAAIPTGVVGSLISSFTGGVSDVDSGAVKGIAITSSVETNGTWYYTINNGTTWTAVGSVSSASSLLLADNANTRLYFAPGANYNGTSSSALTVRGWDQTSGTAGTKVDTSSNGGITAYSSATDVIDVNVTAVNDAPVLDNAGTMTLTTITEDQTTNVGNTVASIISSAGGDRITDVDAAAVEGIAIRAITSGNGTWEYSLNGGTNWTSVGAVSGSSALLLRSTDLLRFVPNAQNATTGDITFNAWDQTSGTAGNKVDVSTTGGTTAFSSTTEVASISVTSVNDAPTITNAATASLTGTNENSTSSGTTASTILASVSWADVDTSALSGLAITATTGSGTWEYSTDGITWTSFGAVNATNALLISSTTQVHYIGNNLNGETATFSFQAWDQTTGTASANGSAQYATPGAGGGTTAFSSQSANAQIITTSVNDAPLLDNSGTMTLTSLTEDQTVNSGNTVASIISSAGGDRISDVDSGAVEGIAVTGLTSGNGSWQFSTDGGSTWSAIGVVSDSSALLLRSTDLVRFVPNAQNATTGDISFRAWDQTTGAFGNKVDASVNGGTTAFSSSSETANISVSAVNDAPVLDNTGTMTLSTITEDATTNSGDSIASILASAGGDRVTDVDTGSVEGIAITSLASGNGTWQYSLDNGSTWNSVGAVSPTSSLLLRSTDKIRFVPDALNSDTATFTFRAWDQTAGTFGTKVDSSINGSSTAFSSSTEDASISVTAVNDAPTITNAATVSLASTTEDANSSTTLVSTIVTNASWADVDTGAVRGIAVTSAVGNGNWQYSVNGTTWTNFGNVTNTAALVLDASTLIRYSPDTLNGETATFTFQAWDQTSGTASADGTPRFGNASTNGGTTAYSSQSATAQMVVSSVNDAAVAVSDTATGDEAGGYANATPGTNPTGSVLSNDWDVDTGDMLSVTGVAAGVVASASGNVATGVTGTYGSISIAADGTYTYTVDNSNPIVQALRTTGQTVTDTFTYTIEDTGGAFSSSQIVITVRGTNDAPVAAADTAIGVEAGGIANATAGSNPTGNVITNDTDVDGGDTKTVIGVVSGTAGSASGSVGSSVLGAYGTINIAANGSYTYTIDNSNSAVQALRSTANTLSDTFTYTIVDAAGLSSTTQIVVTIQGQNDTPNAVNESAIASEAGGVSNGTTGTNPTGNVLSNDTDLDTGDTKTVIGVIAGAASSATGSVGSLLTGAYGSIQIAADGTYTYTVDNANTAVQALRNSSQTLSEVFTYTMQDTAAATSTATITITIEGLNDAPVAVANTATAFEAGGINNSISGSDPTGNVLTNDSDVDAGDTKTVTGVVAGVAGTASGLVGTSVAGAYGSIVIHSNGTYLYTLDNNNATVEALNAGSPALSDTFTYTMTDTAGLTSTTTIVISIEGADDLPFAVADYDTAVEAGGSNNATVGTDPTGNVLTNDVAPNGEFIVGVAAGIQASTIGSVSNSVAGSYGSIVINSDGTYSYSINNNNSAVQALRLTSDHLTDIFSYTMRDSLNYESTTQITITIDGANDDPIAYDDSSIAIEAGGVSNGSPGSTGTGNVLSNDTDVDLGDSKSLVGVAAGGVASATGSVGASVTGSYGSIVIGLNGAYTYTVNNNLAAVQALRTSSDTLSEVFTYTMEDTAGAMSTATVTITIQGANDGPMALFDTANAYEAGGVANGSAGVNPTGNVLNNDTDVDSVGNGETKAVSGVVAGTAGSASGSVGSNVAGTYGAITINSDGTYTYIVDNSNSAVQALRTSGQTLDDVFTYTMRDTAGAFSTTQITVTIHGANDTPTNIGDTNDATEAGGTANGLAGINPTGNLLSNDGDVDAGDSLNVSGVAAGTVGTASGSVGTSVAGAFGSLQVANNGVYSYTVNNSNLSVQGLLSYSDTLTEIFTYTIQDASGATSTSQITFTIHGQNDAPVGQADNAFADEAGGTANGTPGSNPSGNVITNDIEYDLGDTTFVSGVEAGIQVSTSGDVGSVVAGSYGSITIASDGSYSYSVDNSNASVQQLRLTANTLIDVFSYTIQDAGGLASTTQITITLRGANDAPVGVADSATAVEAGGLSNATAGSSPTGNVLGNDTDVDASDTKSVSAVASGVIANPSGPVGSSINGLYGAISIAANGVYTYVIDNNNSTVQALRTTADTLLDVFSYTVVDNLGLSSTTQITVTIQGANDTPVAVNDSMGVAVEAGGVSNGSGGSNATGNVLSNDTDVDATGNGETKTVSGVLAGIQASAAGNVGTTVTGTYGAITISSDGSYTYLVDNNNATVQALRTSANTLTDVFTYTMVDALGLASTAQVTVTLEGSNDAPTSVFDTATAIEAGGIANGTAGTNPTGNVLSNDTDVDSGDTKSVNGVAAGTVGSAVGFVGTNVSGTFGSINIASNGSYTYTVDSNNSTVQALRTTSDTITDVFTYTMVDALGLSSTTQITVTIQGANDAPVSVVDTAIATEAGGISNGSAGTDPTGNVLANDTDVDSGDTKTVSGVVAGTSGSASGSVGANVAGAFGTINIASDGSYTYTVNNSNISVQALRTTGNTLSDVFTYSMQDALGLLSTTQITVTIQGSNDAPTSVFDTAIATEAGGVSNGTSGINPTGNVLANDTDVDSGDTKTVSGVVAGTAASASGSVGSNVSGTYGTISIASDGTYTYTVDNSNTTVQALRTTANTISDVFTYTMVDAAGLASTTQITVTIQGSNDAPVSVFDTAIATEAGGVGNGTTGVNPTGNVLTNDTDTDSTDTKAISGVAAGTFASASGSVGTNVNGAYGSISFASNGNYTYTVNNSNSTVQALRTISDTITDIFTYTMVDTAGLASTTQITITIQGTNDTPHDLATIGLSVAENANNGSVVGTMTRSDVDAGDTPFYSLFDNAGGRFAIDSTTGVVTVADGSLLNYETLNSHNITVRIADLSGAFYDEVFTVSLVDVNEFATTSITDTNVSSNTIAENTSNGTVVGITAFASDADGTTNAITYSLDNNAGGRFTVNSSTGVVTVANSSLLNYELATSHAIVVRATSADTSFSTQSFTINLTDVNEFAISAISDSDIATNYVLENATLGTTVGLTALATDADTTATVTYALDDNAGGRFAIDSITGVVTVAGAIDREHAASYNITIRATSSDASTVTSIRTIAIGDVDEFDVGAVTDSNNVNNEIHENAVNGTVVGITAVASDTDATTNTITYSLDDNSGGRFAIDSSTGVVTVLDGSLLDFETTTSHGIVVRATSVDTSFSTQNYTINLTDVNEGVVSAISDTDGTTDTVLENATIGTLVGITANATDPDGTDTVSYSLDDDAGGLFTIHATTGVVTVAGAIDRETAASYNITIRATSSDTSFSTSTTTIAIGDVDEFNVGAVTDSNAVANSVIENATIGTTVGIVASANDADATTYAITYTLSDNDGGRFAIDAGTGVVTVAGGIDRELDGSTRTITVRATSADASYSEEIFSINIVDANEFSVTVPTDVNATANSIDENVAIGTVVGITASASDSDSTTNTITYSLFDNDGGNFTIDANTGVVTTAAAINRESLGASRNITVRATSVDGSTSDAVFTININDLDEFDVGAVTDGNSGSNTINENAVNGTIVGITASAGDSDATTNTITYSLDDNAGGRFAIDSSTGVVTVLDGSLLDYETTTSHGIVVRATSADSSFSTQNYTINLSDVNESAISIISDTDVASNYVLENMSIGTIVGITALATDADGTDTVTYSLDDNSGGRFAIDPTTGVVTVAGAIDREAAASYNITIRATSSDTSFSTSTRTIAIGDVDEFNVGTVTDSNATINSVVENATVGTVVGVTGFASDADATTNVITYTLTDNDGGRFAIDSSTGVVTVAGGTDRESDGSTRVITVRATSADASYSEEIFTINIVDDDEFNVSLPTDIDTISNFVDENAVIGTLVGITANAFDLDSTSSLVTYTLDDDAGGRFAINASTGVVTVAGSIDREIAAAYSITIRATSSDSSTSTMMSTISIGDIDEFDTGAVIDSFAAMNSVMENASVGTIVGVTAFALDADAPAVVSYSLDDNAGGRFAINSVTGVVTVAGGIDREMAASYDITIRATSDDSSTSTLTTTIAIGDADEFNVGVISDLNNTLNTVAENSPNGAVVGITANAFDLDATTNVLSYSLTNSAGGRFTIDSVTGIVTVANGGLLDYESNNSHTLRVQATSLDGSSSVRDFTITLTNVNEKPFGNADSYSTTFIDTISKDALSGLISNDFDPDGDILSVLLVSGPTSGSFSLRSDGGFTYVPVSGFTGLVTFEYRVSDGLLVSDTITGTIAVTMPLSNQNNNSGTENTNNSGNNGSSSFSTIEQSLTYGSSSIASLNDVGSLSPAELNSATDTSTSNPQVSQNEELISSLPLDSISQSQSNSDLNNPNLFVNESIIDGIITRQSSSSNESSFQNFRDNSVRRTLNRDSESASRESISSDKGSISDESKGGVITDGGLVNTVIGTGMVIWIIQGAQILAAVLSAAPTMIQLDPMSVLPNLQPNDKELEGEKDSDIFDKK